MFFKFRFNPLKTFEIHSDNVTNAFHSLREKVKRNQTFEEIFMSNIECFEGITDETEENENEK